MEDNTSETKRHWWGQGPHYVEVCRDCGDVRGPDSGKEVCIPYEWWKPGVKVPRRVYSPPVK